MDAVGGSIIESPVTMSHEQLPSPLTFDGPFSIPGGLDMAAVATATPRRRSSKGHQGAIVKRSMSSPNVRSLSTGSEPALNLSEKRRNKLGYHRTSVACVHCRRRKIRCLLAPDDPQNRCSNCIRLKKECNFFPVDQQPQSERRPRTGSKIDVKSGGGSVSSSSSPNVPGNRPSEHGDTFTHFQNLPHAAYSTGMVSLGSSGMSPPGSAAPQSSRFDLPEQPSGVGWDMRFFEGQQIPTNHPSSGGDEHGQPHFWKVPDTPLTPASYSPYSSTHSTVHYPHHPWPIRSMSYGQIDEHTHHRHDSHSSAVYGGTDHLRRSTIDMPPPAPPSLGAHSGSTVSTAGTSMAGDVSGQQGMSTGQIGYGNMSHSWNMLPTQSPKSMDFGSGGWYADPNHLSKVHEDEVSHFGGDLQGGMYTSR